jgi:hypothetical protein
MIEPGKALYSGARDNATNLNRTPESPRIVGSENIGGRIEDGDVNVVGVPDVAQKQEEMVSYRWDRRVIEEGRSRGHSNAGYEELFGESFLNDRSIPPFRVFRDQLLFYEFEICGDGRRE